ncbi:hypothetical protein F751_2730 [Auxenochlorella protothecoides]|uniref:Uncharacterized protein n=1 Tax=Auxenochlorella protothecoides TaxID=3075 RepID=A0A087SPT5_AUXPR|nr:hypothetical protein F751_2730 [Auxenochlorella protothecoides]KFM27739.1 hypothetical protein F751_2730 [Auxenochlorella protothecoides]
MRRAQGDASVLNSPIQLARVRGARHSVDVAPGPIMSSSRNPASSRLSSSC